jgi:hypothetical protein
MHGLTSKEIQELRSQAQTPWLGAGITNLKFQALLKEAKKKKGIKEKETKKVKSESPNSFSDENSVKVFGSSVVGQAFGIEAFKKAEKFLTLLSSKGRLKCRTQWCRACSLYKLELSKGVVGHVGKNVGRNLRLRSTHFADRLVPPLLSAQSQKSNYGCADSDEADQ